MAIAAGRRIALRMSRHAWDVSIPVPLEEWQLLEVMQPNVLIAGPVSGTNAALTALIVACFRPPIACWEPGQPLVLPPGQSSGTLILREVAALSTAEQHQLLDWLEQSEGTMQVVATSSLPLLPLAEGGAFDTRLYYRLNVIYMESAA